MYFTLLFGATRNFLALAIELQMSSENKCQIDTAYIKH